MTTLRTTPSSLKRPLAALLACGLLLGAAPSTGVADASAKATDKPATDKSGKGFGGDGRKN